MYHPKSASYKISKGEIKIDERTPPSQQNIISIPGPKNTTHKGVVISGKALGSTAENTHFFDGKLMDNSFFSLIEKDAVIDIKENISRAGKIDDSIKVKAFKDLDNFIHTQKNYMVTQNATRCLRVITSIHETYGRLPGNQNYSPNDDLHASDLLYLLYEKIIIDKNMEYLSLLLTQLDEMATGLCVQGKCNRLFQTYVMLRDDLTPTSKPVRD